MQSLNLIRDPWIPVRHRSGRRSTRTPWDVFGDKDDPVVALASPRADFDGGIAQLLIGLLQTVLPPKNEEEWLKRAERPPDAGELRERLEPLNGAFELLGQGPRFQQDDRVAASGAKFLPAEKLLIDLGLDEGADHFSQNGSVGALCLPCAAAALATLQTSAPAGGRGNMTSLRGGGPLTTLVVAADPEATLWTTLWLNVLPSTSRAETIDSAAAEIFPWMARQTPGEPARAPEVTPGDAHPLQVFFGMPRRLWLGEASEGDCGVCGRSRQPTVGSYQSRPNGIRYTGAWIHPLSPYRRFKGEEWLAVKGDEHGIGYRHWLGLVVSTEGGDVQPALSMKEVLGDNDRFGVARELRLWAFGYAMDNMKAKAWSEALMPIFAVPAEIAVRFADEVRKLVEGARLAESYVRLAFKKLVARRPKDVKREPAQVSARFWERTERRFYETAGDVLDALSGDKETQALRERWHRDLAREASHIFDLEVAEADFRASDPAQVARAWNELQRALYGKKLKQILELPIESSKSKKKGGKG